MVGLYGFYFGLFGWEECVDNGIEREDRESIVFDFI